MATKPIMAFTRSFVGITLGTVALGATAGLSGATKALTQIGVGIGTAGYTLGEMGQFLGLKKSRR